MNLKVFHNSVDYTKRMGDFTEATKSINLANGDILLGSVKPLKKIFIQLVDRVDATSTMTVKYYNGTAYASVTGLVDETFGLTEAGFISWDEDLEQEENNLDSHGEMHWLKISTSTNPTVAINGINLVLSSDKDLSFIPGITDFLDTDETSFIAFHQEARNLIVQMLRNSGKKISLLESNSNPSPDYIETRQVEVFDLLNIEEFKNASKYLALHLIFDHISKIDQDIYHQKSLRYYERFLSSFNTNLVTIDANNNGKTDEAENLAVQFIRIKRE